MLRLWSLFLFVVAAVHAQPVSTWSVRTSGTTANLWGVAAATGSATDPAAGRVVAVGEQGTLLVSSDDGVTWSRVLLSTNAWLTAVTYAPGLKRFFAVGDGGLILSSGDGLTWIPEASPTNVRLNGVSASRNSNVVFAVGEASAGLVVRSNSAWTRAEVGFDSRWLRGATSGGMVVGAAGAVFVETDTSSAFPNGAVWSALPAIPSVDLEAAVAFSERVGDRTVVAVGANGTVLRKEGGTSFVSVASGTSERLRGLCHKVGGGLTLVTSANQFSIGELFAVGTNGTILRSPDGAVWRPDVSPTVKNLHAVAAGQVYVFAVGDGGTILRAGGPNSGPVITRQPTVGVDEQGRPFVEATVAEEGALTYYWVQQSAGAPHPVGKSGPRQLLPTPLFPGRQTVYQLYVYNAFGVARSDPVLSNRFVDLAARARVGAGSDILIGGFSVAGDLPTGRDVLVRAVGPGLAEFNIETPLRAPVLTIFSKGQPIASNRNWETNGNVAAIVAATNRLGTFPLRAGRADAALLLNLSPGNYTAHVESGDGTTGIALVEIYDVDGQPLAHLANISARAQVRAGEGALIGGLVIAGGPSKKVLLRAAGPAMTAFNLTGVLAEPKLTLYRDGVVIATATSWGAAANLAELRPASSAVGAFAFAEGSKDAAMLIELPHGAYTLGVTGANGGEGLALVEVYHVP